MTKKLNVQKLGWLRQLADTLMIPLMHCLSGTMEKPQQTHFWNNIKLKKQNVEHLDPENMVRCQGVTDSTSRKILGIPIFHIPILGGWRDYVVLELNEEGCDSGWHVGWITDDVIGVSRIKLANQVRFLLGPGDVTFFGVTTSGKQISIRQSGDGRIGDGGSFGKIPLV